MSESGDYDPGYWKGYDFSEARKAYDVHVGRSYDDAKKEGKKLEELVEPKVSTKSASPLVIICDVTGSMGEWPATMFSKLPYLELEGKEYLGEDMEICFAAVGDAHCDKYALQVRPFSKGKDLEKRLKELVIEGGGGPGVQESYELAALYFNHNVEMPNATKPILIMIGDEAFYDRIDAGQAKKYANVKLQADEKASSVFEELKNKFSTYLIRKPYSGASSNSMSPQDKRIYKRWEAVMGEERISDLPDPNRVVDVIFGILAQETGRVDYFKKELKDRQKPEQVTTVLKSLETVHKLPAGESVKKLKAGDSVLKSKHSGKEAKSLA